LYETEKRGLFSNEWNENGKKRKKSQKDLKNFAKKSTVTEKPLQEKSGGKNT